MFPVLGIDPGVNGGMCIVAPPGGEPIVVHAFHPKDREEDVVSTVVKYVEKAGRNNICLMEKVGYIRGDGGKGAFTFGKVYGLLRGAVHSTGVRIHDVSPMVWQTRMGCLTGGDKNVSKRRAQELFPYWVESITHNTADAMLIARYGWQVYSGGIFSPLSPGQTAKRSN